MLTNLHGSELDQLLGLTKAKVAVRRLLESKSNVHAVLFAGPQGSGVDELAQYLARGWMCKSSETRPCGDCAPCRAMRSGNAVDFQVIEPFGPSRLIQLWHMIEGTAGAPNPPPSIPVLTFFRVSPIQAAAKVVMIRDADRMNNRAFNALLKTLEEPPKFGKLILTTDAISRVAPTILSRCLVVPCELMGPDEYPADLTAWERIFGENAPGRIAQIREGSTAYQSLYQTLEDVANRPGIRALRLSEALREHGEVLAKKMGGGVRQGHAEVLRCLALFWRAQFPNDALGPAKIAESHRLILANGSAGLIFDALLLELTA